MATHHQPARTEKGTVPLRTDTTPYHFMNAFLVVFWFTYLGIAATYVVALLCFSPAYDTSMWIPVIFYSLSAAFLALLISTTCMHFMLRRCDPVRAEAMLKIPMVTAAAILILRFTLPLISTIQSYFL